MKKEIIAIAAIALISTMAAVSCGKDVEQDSVSVALPKVTVASGEQTTTKGTGTGTATTTKTTATAVVVSGTGSTTTDADDDEKDTETTTATKDEDDTPTIEPTEKPTEAPTEAPAAQSLNKTVFGIGDLGQQITSVISNPDLPTPLPGACISKGDEPEVSRYYYGQDLFFDCYSSGGAKYIANVYIKSSNYSLDSGITVGSSKDSVISTYGEPIKDNNNIMYAFGDKVIYFVLNGDTVSEIQVNYE